MHKVLDIVKRHILGEMLQNHLIPILKLNTGKTSHIIDLSIENKNNVGTLINYSVYLVLSLFQEGNYNKQ